VELDDPFGDREPQAGATLFRRGGVLNLSELFKDLLLISLRNAWTRIRHRDHERAIGNDRLDPNLTAIGKLNRASSACSCPDTARGTWTLVKWKLEWLS
jgi:hypothetical protein